MSLAVLSDIYERRYVRFLRVAEAIVGEVGQADGVEEGPVPRRVVAEVGPLAHRGAQRTDVASGRTPRQVVGEIEPTIDATPRLGQLALHPTRGRLTRTW